MSLTTKSTFSSETPIVLVDSLESELLVEVEQRVVVVQGDLFSVS